jgi:outer membrane protein OmpA-like peptidoglycan-associated protein
MELNSKKLANLKNELGTIEANLQKYQKVFMEDGVLTAEENDLLNKMFLTVEDSRKFILKFEENNKSKLLDISNQALNNLESIENATSQIQEIIPEFLPVLKEIIDGCTLTITNYGYISIEKTSILSGGIQFFSLNNNPVEIIELSKNCSGTITMISTWFYVQDVSNPLALNTYGRITSNMTYSLSFPFRVDEEGNIKLFKGTITIINNEIGSKVDNFFFIKELDVNLESDTLVTITGGLTQNTESIFPETVKKYLNNQIKGNKELTTSFSISLELKKEKEIKIKPKVKKLVFEKENQAILSSDQTSVLIEWWKKIDIELKKLIKNRKASIEIIGYTSPTGSNDYNLNLGEERAIHTKNTLTKIIGKDSEGNSRAIIYTKSWGENTEYPQRYVQIIITKI